MPLQKTKKMKPKAAAPAPMAAEPVRSGSSFFRKRVSPKALMQFKSLNASVGAGDFMLEGEPAAGADAENQTPGAQEPYVDRNADEQWNEGEPYVEVVHDKAYTGSFDFVDQNANELWDMGVRNMYLVGRWSLPQ